MFLCDFVRWCDCCFHRPLNYALYCHLFSLSYISLISRMNLTGKHHTTDVQLYSVWEKGATDASGFLGYTYLDLYPRGRHVQRHFRNIPTLPILNTLSRLPPSLPPFREQVRPQRCMATHSWVRSCALQRRHKRQRYNQHHTHPSHVPGSSHGSQPSKGNPRPPRRPDASQRCGHILPRDGTRLS